MGFPADHPAIRQAFARGLVAGGPVRTRTLPPGVLDPPPPGCSEKPFQARVIALAESNDWRAYHTHDSRKSAAGFPDLVLVRGPVLIFAELKTDAGTVAGAQAEWLELLRGVPGVKVRL